MLDLRFTSQFKKDYKLAQKRGFDLSEFETVVNKLRNREPLEERFCQDGHIIEYQKSEE